MPRCGRLRWRARAVEPSRANPSILKLKAITSSSSASTNCPTPSDHAQAGMSSRFSRRPLVLVEKMETQARWANPESSVCDHLTNFGKSWALSARFTHIDSCVTSSEPPQSRQMHGSRRPDYEFCHSLRASRTTLPMVMDTISVFSIGGRDSMSRSRLPSKRNSNSTSASARSKLPTAWSEDGVKNGAFCEYATPFLHNRNSIGFPIHSRKTSSITFVFIKVACGCPTVASRSKKLGAVLGFHGIGLADQLTRTRDRRSCKGLKSITGSCITNLSPNRAVAN